MKYLVLILSARVADSYQLAHQTADKGKFEFKKKSIKPLIKKVKLEKMKLKRHIVA